MFGHLPDHLSQLNSISSPPATSINPESEEAFWDFMHTDELFEKFTAPPESPNATPVLAVKDERKSLTVEASPVLLPAAVAPTPQDITPAPAAAAAVAASGMQTPVSAITPAQTLESFLAAFANEPPLAAAASYRMAVPLPLPYNALASASGAQAQQKLQHIDTSAIQPFQPIMTPYTAASTPAADERPSGAKRLKQLGAGPMEIEEDKRRRNTEASARFRAKKKEREQAVEHRAKALEVQVAQLTAEKASLENENKLLKAIVLGGQGVSGGAEAVSSALAQLGDKRLRD